MVSAVQIRKNRRRDLSHCLSDGLQVRVRKCMYKTVFSRVSLQQQLPTYPSKKTIPSRYLPRDPQTNGRHSVYVRDNEKRISLEGSSDVYLDTVVWLPLSLSLSLSLSPPLPPLPLYNVYISCRGFLNCVHIMDLCARLFSAPNQEVEGNSQGLALLLERALRALLAPHDLVPRPERAFCALTTSKQAIPYT